MHIAVMHRDNRPWRAPGNHLDGRVCPDCGTTVHGSKSQAKHRAWHLQLNMLAAELAKRTGITEAGLDVPWRWGAEVQGADDDSQDAELEEAAE
jgi:hypothetical protein